MFFKIFILFYFFFKPFNFSVATLYFDSLLPIFLKFLPLLSAALLIL